MKSFAKFTGKNLCRSLFNNFTLKKDFGTGVVFLCFSGHSLEHRFYMTPPVDCFCKFQLSRAPYKEFTSRNTMKPHTIPLKK